MWSASLITGQSGRDFYRNARVKLMQQGCGMNAAVMQQRCSCDAAAIRRPLVMQLVHIAMMITHRNNYTLSSAFASSAFASSALPGECISHGGYTTRSISHFRPINAWTPFPFQLHPIKRECFACDYGPKSTLVGVTSVGILLLRYLLLFWIFFYWSSV